MREFWIVVFCALTAPCLGQFEYAQVQNDVTSLRKQVDSLQEEVRRLTGENEALRAQLRATPQPEPRPADPPQPEPRPVAKLLGYTATWCQACQQDKTSAEVARVQTEMPITWVDVDKLQPGQFRPQTIPYYELHIGGLKAKYTGRLTFERFRAMQGAVLDRLKPKRPVDDFIPAPAGD